MSVDSKKKFYVIHEYFKTEAFHQLRCLDCMEGRICYLFLLLFYLLNFDTVLI